jgi:DivIVA domain-containing protein
MDYKVELTAKTILDEKFTRDVKGYNPDEVDAFLDKVIQDYLVFTQFRKESQTNEEGLEKQIQTLQAEKQDLVKDNQALYSQKRQLEIDNASLHHKLDGIKPGDKPTAENVEYISRVNQLEDFLWSIGYDPRTLKKKS